MPEQIPYNLVPFFADKTAPRSNRQLAYHYGLAFRHNRMITALLNPHDKRQIIPPHFPNEHNHLLCMILYFSTSRLFFQTLNGVLRNANRRNSASLEQRWLMRMAFAEQQKKIEICQLGISRI